MRSIIIDNIIESVPIGLLVIDPDGEIALSNQSAAEILGFDRNDLVGKGWAEVFFHEKRNDDFNQVFLDAIWQKRINLQRHVDYWRPTGEPRYLSVNSSFLLEDAEVAGVVVLISDITELHLTREREKIALKEKARFQKERVEALKQLALRVAHEIRNPTVIIGGFARRMLIPLEKKNETCETRNYLNYIISGSKRLEAIVESVKEYADISFVHQTRVKPSLLFEAAVEVVRKKIPETHRDFEIDIINQTLEITADPVLLNTALVEVLLNAAASLKDETGRVTIKGSMDKDAYQIEITDNGHGIPEKDMPFIFDLFYSTRTDSLGMGLPKAQRAIAESKGQIQINSRPEAGTTVSITIPQGER